MRKALAGVMAGILAAGMLTACGASEPAKMETAAKTEEAGKETDSEDAGSDEVKVLDVVWFSDGKEGETFTRLTEKYTETHPNIQFEMIEVPYSELENKLKNMVNAGEQPALTRISNIGTFQNQLLDLGEYIDADAFRNNFGSGLQYEFDGKILGAPMDITANGLIYNKTAFEQAGVAVPQSEDEIWTWEEFEEALKTVMANSDCKYGMVVDLSPQRFTTLMYEAGGSMLTEDLSASNFKSEGVKRGIEWFRHLHEEGIVPTSVWLGSENPNEMFRTGQVATHLAGSWMVSNYKEEITDFEWGVTYLPKDVQRASIPGGKYISAFQGSGVEQEAAEFIEWLSQPENNAEYCKENYYLSQVKGNESLDYDFGAEYFKLFSNELNATDAQPGAEWGYQAFTTLVQTDLKAGVQDVLAENITIDEFIESMDALITESLDELN